MLRTGDLGRLTSASARNAPQAGRKPYPNSSASGERLESTVPAQLPRSYPGVLTPPSTIRTLPYREQEMGARAPEANPLEGAHADGLPSSEPMKMTTCTVVVNWRYSCASTNSPSELRLASAAAVPDALRGSLAFLKTQLPLCPMAKLGLGLCSSPARPPASSAPVSPAPGAARRAGT